MTGATAGEARRGRATRAFTPTVVRGGALAPGPRLLRRRLAALVVDAVLLATVIAAAAAAIDGLLGAPLAFALGPGAIRYDVALARATALVGVATGCAYHCLAWTLVGGTPGQRLLGLRVRGADGRAAPSPGRALVRWAALGAPLWIASYAVPGWPGVAAAAGLCAWATCLLVSTARSADGRGLHDRISGTRVERIASQPALHVRRALDVR